MNPEDETNELIERSSNFNLSLLTPEERWNDEYKSHKVHKTVLKPILAIADKCWAYGIENDSEALSVASSILHREKGKFRVNISGDPITGKEFFWNAHTGKRGTITITVPIERFNPHEIFKACRNVSVVVNYRSGHNSAAINFAHQTLKLNTHIVFCLPRNNGIEWMDVFAPKPLVFELFSKAQVLCGTLNI